MNGRDGFLQVLRGEWTKFRSVRSTAWCVLLGVGLMILVSIVSANGSSIAVAGGGPQVQDKFHFVHQPLTGDGTVVAQVLTQENTGPWAKAGIIIKESTEPGTTYAALMVTPGHGVRLQADFKTDLAGSRTKGPRWLKLTRTGNTITGYESADGAGWSTVGSVVLGALPQTAEVGLFVASPAVGERIVKHGTGTEGSPDWEASTATFGDVSVASAGGAASGQWQDLDVSGPGREVDRQVAGSAHEAGGVFTVSGVGDISGEQPASQLQADDLVRNSLVGVYIGLIALVTLGVVFATSEFKTGTIRTTFAASPRRGRVLAAKALVLGTSTFAAGLVASVAALYGALPIMRGNGFKPPRFPTPSLSDGAVLRAVVGTALVLAVLALFGLGLGTVMRRSSGPVTLVIALVVVPSIVSDLLPLDVERWLVRLTPLAGFAIQATNLHRFDVWIRPWAGFGVLCAYAAVALAAAFWLLRRRDTDA
jgi:ABC-type transport system involved in multi-copper enzyme maturation permease subunit